MVMLEKFTRLMSSLSTSKQKKKKNAGEKLGPPGWQYSNMGSCDRKMANAKRQLNVKLYNHFSGFFLEKEAISARSPY